MKRSEINKALKESEAMREKYCCYLPPFCHFTPEQWQSIGYEYDEVRNCMFGWNITDYGMGDFDKMGFSLITIRNGNRQMPDKYPKGYAEKLLNFGKAPGPLTEAELREVVTFACTSAGLSTTRSGGISSVPEYAEVTARMSR